MAVNQLLGPLFGFFIGGSEDRDTAALKFVMNEFELFPVRLIS